MTKLPYLPLFFGDFLASTFTWTGEQQSLYLLLLGYQWVSGPLPTDINELAGAVRYDRKKFMHLWSKVGTKFIETPEGLINERLEQHRSKAGDITKKRSSAGKEGAASRWGSNKDANGTSRSERLANARKLGSHSKGEWAALVEACGNQCVKCKTPASQLNGGGLCKDHIEPIYAGGSDAISNIQPMCRNCNSAKGGRLADFRPNDWHERLAKCLTDDRQDACNPIQPNPTLRGLPRREG